MPTALTPSFLRTAYLRLLFSPFLAPFLPSAGPNPVCLAWLSPLFEIIYPYFNHRRLFFISCLSLSLSPCLSSHSPPRPFLPADHSHLPEWTSPDVVRAMLSVLTEAATHTDCERFVGRLDYSFAFPLFQCCLCCLWCFSAVCGVLVLPVVFCTCLSLVCHLSVIFFLFTHCLVCSFKCHPTSIRLSYIFRFVFGTETCLPVYRLQDAGRILFKNDTSWMKARHNGEVTVSYSLSR